MQPVDLTGQVFGRWTVVGPRHVRRSIPIWRCRCSCGSEKWVVSQTLRNGSSRSCGCLNRELSSQRARLVKKRHRVLLTEAGRQQLQEIGNLESQILLLSDESEAGPHLTDKQISEHLGVTRTKVEYTRTKFAAPEEIRRRAISALKEMARDPRRRQLRLETLRRYDEKPTTKLKKAAYRQNMPLRVREHKN